MHPLTRRAHYRAVYRRNGSRDGWPVAPHRRQAQASLAYMNYSECLLVHWYYCAKVKAP
jgi:hypothetical protein